MERLFNYLYIKSEYALPGNIIVQGCETIERGDCPRDKQEANMLALELAKQLVHDKNALAAKIQLFHSDYKYEANAVYIRQ